MVQDGVAETEAQVRRAVEAPDWLVHESRKSCKRWRSYLQLVEGELRADARQAQRMIRDATQALGTQRDAAARLECLMLLEAVTDAPCVRADIGALRERLAHANRHSEQETRALLEAFGVALRELADFMKSRMGVATPIDLPKSLQESRAQVRKAWQRAEAAPHDAHIMHEWRKKVQRLKYQLRLPYPLARHDQMDRLSDCLGEIHDLDLLQEFLQPRESGAGKRAGEIGRAAAASRARLQAEAFALAADLFPPRSGPGK
jgi:CHAD domain-containing protein